MLEWKIVQEEKTSKYYYTVYYARIGESGIGVWVEKLEKGIEIVFNISISIISNRVPVIGDYILFQSDHFCGTFDYAVSKVWDGVREIRDGLNIVLDKYTSENVNCTQENKE